MPLKIDKRCKVCAACKADPNLLKRLYDTKVYKKGGESLLEFARDTGLNYAGLGRHTKRHQFISSEDLDNHKLKVIHKQQSDMMVKQAITAGSARQSALDKLAVAIEDQGEIKVGDNIALKDVIALLLKATKDADDVQAKKKDQERDIVKMMMGVRSGSGSVDAEDDLVIDYDEFDAPIEGEIVG